MVYFGGVDESNYRHLLSITTLTYRYYLLVSKMRKISTNWLENTNYSLFKHPFKRKSYTLILRGDCSKKQIIDNYCGIIDNETVTLSRMKLSTSTHPLYFGGLIFCSVGFIFLCYWASNLKITYSSLKETLLEKIVKSLHFLAIL